MGPLRQVGQGGLRAAGRRCPLFTVHPVGFCWDCCCEQVCILDRGFKLPHPVSPSAQWCVCCRHSVLLLLQLLCLDVHPSRPTLAATGGSAGTVAIWDLRFQAAPLALTGGRSAYGDVCQVRGAGVHEVLGCWHYQTLCSRCQWLGLSFVWVRAHTLQKEVWSCEDVLCLCAFAAAFLLLYSASLTCTAPRAQQQCRQCCTQH
jgi:hypothetical protein